MGLFSVDYKNMPGDGVYAQGGLKFRADEEALCRLFAPILPYVSLNDLIGEAVFWCMLPSTVAIWTFLFLLNSQGILFAIIASVVLYLFAEIFHRACYLKPLNYVVFILGNKVLSLVVYIIWIILLLLSGSVVKGIILGGWFLFFYIGVGEALSFIFLALPLLPIGRIYFKKTRKFLFLPKSDQVLVTIGRYYARKFGVKLPKEEYGQETARK